MTCSAAVSRGDTARLHASVLVLLLAAAAAAVASNWLHNNELQENRAMGELVVSTSRTFPTLTVPPASYAHAARGRGAITLAGGHEGWSRGGPGGGRTRGKYHAHGRTAIFKDFSSGVRAWPCIEPSNAIVSTRSLHPFAMRLRTT